MDDLEKLLARHREEVAAAKHKKARAKSAEWPMYESSCIHCCHHCEDRHIGCHDQCEKYKKEVAENEKRKAAVQKEHDQNSAYRKSIYKTCNTRRRRY